MASPNARSTILPRMGRAIGEALATPVYWHHTRRARRAMTHRSQQIRYGEHRRQYVLVLHPPELAPDVAAPWAFYLHGGAWTFGSPEQFMPAAGPWLRRGFRVALPSYRRPPSVGLQGIVADCRRAVEAVAASGLPLGIAQVGGISAGGHLAALLALHPEWWTEAGWPAGPDRALLCAAPLDLRLLWPPRLFGGSATINPAQIAASAAHPPRFLMIHGTRDGFVPHDHSRVFSEALPADRGRLITLPGGTHLDTGRWCYDPGHPTLAHVVDFIES